MTRVVLVTACFLGIDASVLANTLIRSEEFWNDGAKYHLIADETNSSINVSMCRDGACVQIPVSNLNATDVESGKLSFQNVLLGNPPQLLITTAGDVNVCSIIYRLDYATKRMTRINFSGGGMCNFARIGDFLTSSYRESGNWYVDVYRNDEKNPILISKNRELDCSQYVQWGPSNPSARRIIVVSKNVVDGRQAIATIKSKRAILFGGPQSDTMTNMYLIAGDQVRLLDYKSTSDGSGGWYEVEYRKGKSIKKWIREDDVGMIGGAASCNE